ncbi:MAG: GTP-binding protein, partial [Clostridia bacterium]|nr:GTP-binding protein [Clostridia bacterium]
MATIDTKSLRNVALLGHGGCGKTSIAEAMLYLTGGTDRLGKTADGNTVCDYDPEEVKRGFSISASLAPISWKNMKINIFDTPGYLDFVGEVHQSLRAADSALICVDAKSGVEVGTELAWDYATAAGLPKAFFINKCEDHDADFETVFNSLRDNFGNTLCPVFVPVKSGDKVTMIDLVEMKAFAYDAKGKRSEIPMTDDLKDIAANYKEAFNEAVAGTSDELMMKYFDGEEITKEEAAMALHQGIFEGTITPVYCGSAVNMWGIVAILDAIVESFPRHTAKKVEKSTEGADVEIDPAGSTSIFVFKTVADPFVGKMSFFKVMNGTLKKDMTLKNLTNGTAEKMAHIYTVKGKNQTEVDELACGDIGMIAKLANTNTNDTLTDGSEVAYAKITYPTPYMSQAMVPATAKDESKISQSMARMLEEDLTLKYVTDPETHQMVLSGIG